MIESICYSRRYRLVLWLPLFALLLHCSSGTATMPPSKYERLGLASYYGKKFHGRRTASGERYNMHALTAAHRSVPFGTMVTVTHLQNGRTVRVRINDRGPFVKGRIIDLSYAAAKQLGMVTEGVARVKIRLER